MDAFSLPSVAQSASYTSVIPAKYPYAAKIRFGTLSQSNLLKEKEYGAVVLFHFTTDVVQRQTEAGLPKLQSCSTLCAACKRLVKILLINGECTLTQRSKY